MRSSRCSWSAPGSDPQGARSRVGVDVSRPRCASSARSCCCGVCSVPGVCVLPAPPEEGVERKEGAVKEAVRCCPVPGRGRLLRFPFLSVLGERPTRVLWPSPVRSARLGGRRAVAAGPFLAVFLSQRCFVSLTSAPRRFCHPAGVREREAWLSWGPVSRSRPPGRERSRCPGEGQGPHRYRRPPLRCPCASVSCAA